MKFFDWINPDSELNESTGGLAGGAIVALILIIVLFGFFIAKS